jgi:hypothetical protein
MLVLLFIAFIWSQFGKDETKARNTVEAKFNALQVERIDRVRVWPWQGPDETPIELPEEYWPALIRQLQTLKTAEDPSGGNWTTYRALDVEFNRVERYRIYIQTQEGKEDKLIATVRDLQVINDTYFEGHDLWKWMISIPEIKNQPECPPPPS